MKEKDIILFVDGNVTLEVPITPEKDTVWLTQDQMSQLFDTARSSIAYHIGNIFKEGELSKDTSVELFDRSEKQAYRPPLYGRERNDGKSCDELSGGQGKMIDTQKCMDIPYFRGI